MALLYYQTTKSLFSSAIARMLGDTTVNGGPYGPTGITIYAGTPPTAAAVAAAWATYNSTSPDFLVHFTNATWNQPALGPLITMSTYPTAQSPINSGVATWAIIWQTPNPSPAVLAGSVLPDANFIIVSVSNPTGDGVIRLETTTLTAGVPIGIQDASFSTSL